MRYRFKTSISRACLGLFFGLGLSLPLRAAEETGDKPAASAAPPDGLAIETLVAEALEQNPELGFYRAEITAAKAGRKTAGAAAYPELSSRVGYKGVDDLRGDMLGEGVAWEVSVLQPVEWPGRLALRKAIANRDLELAELGLSQFQAVLAARIRSLGYRLYLAQEQAAARREVASRFQALQEVLLQRDTAGLTPLLETRIIEANTLTLERRAREAAQAVQTVLFELNRLRGQPPHHALRVAPAELQFDPAPSLETLLEAARTNNFDVKMKQVELTQQGFHVSLTRRERRPAFTVGPYVSREKAADKETQVGVSLSVPLPFWERSENNVVVAQARQQQAQTALEVAVRRIEQEVAEQAVAYQASLNEMRRWPAEALRRFREAAELADRHYRLGAVPVTTYVELQKQYLEALDALLGTRGEALEAAQQLQLLGGCPQSLVKVTQLGATGAKP